MAVKVWPIDMVHILVWSASDMVLTMVPSSTNAMTSKVHKSIQNHQ